MLPTPPTLDLPRLREDLEALGVRAGMTLIVHSALSRTGWVSGGARTVVTTLQEVLTPAGTLAMPAATPQCLVGEGKANLEAIPVFDSCRTPTAMGAVPECFRTSPDVLRSEHPLESVCAWGRRAVEIVAEHPLDFSEGLETPFDQLHQAESWILLLGVGFNRCTALHYAESLVSNRREARFGFVRVVDTQRVVTYNDNVADDNDTHFPIIGERYLAAGNGRLGQVGEAPCILFPMRDLVDFAKEYFVRSL